MNLTSAFLCCQAIVPGMVEARWGRIVNISSSSAQGGQANMTGYVASKAGLIGFTKSVARELASRGVTVNAVAPGLIETDMTAVIGDEIRKELLRKIPLNCFGQPEDIAHAALYLAGPAARYVTGQVLVVDGGLVM